MAISLSAAKNLSPIPGIRISTAAAGIKYQNRDDLVLFELSEDCNCSAVFTKNQFCAAPVTVAKEHLNQSKVKYLLVNSGNANAGLGVQGIADTKQCCEALARQANCNVVEILPFSTGVIGEPLPVAKISNSCSTLLNDLSEDAWMKAANAIMTTDTVAKGRSAELQLDAMNVTLTGIAKGSGMIRPDMATMLAYVATDLNISNDELNTLLEQAVDQSFHCITVDGDTSTNDACLLMATGQSGVQFGELSESDKNQFSNALNNIFLQLAQSIVRDGEGASKFITVKVMQANNLDMARDIAFTLAHSPLVKTAAFASDPNWGRILAAAGRATTEKIDIDKLSLNINNLQVVKNGELAEGYSEPLGQQEMTKTEIEFCMQLGQGDVEASVWTTDLSYDYVKINAEYRT